MSNTKWTKEQLDAIKEKGSNILVAAAAGSGKTTVLVERIVQKIINENIDIDSILVVTFTNAAASEMKEKILNAIYKYIDENPDNEHLKRQMNLINKANVSTIHSFCLDVIKNNFFEIDISPNFRIGDTSEIELLKIETLDELFDEKYEDNDENFKKLVEIYAGYRGDDPLKEVIYSIHKFIQSFPFPFEWLNEKVEELNITPNKDFSETIWGKIILKDIKQSIDQKIFELQGIERLATEMYDVPNSKNSVKINIDDLEKLKTKMNTWDEFIENLSLFTFSKWVGDKNDNTKIIQDRRNEIIRNFKKNLLDKYGVNSHDAIDDIKYCYPILNDLKNIIKEFNEKFMLKKREKNIIDFNDIEHFALKILVKKDMQGNYIPTEVAKKYQEKFKEIAIDEYQDSNLIQEFILKTISKNNNMFMVGDVKQSIYKFRQARPELFLEKYNSYKCIKDAQEKQDKKIQLFKNFRSRKNILDFTNIIFKEIMSEQLGDINYTEEEFLNLGANYEEPNEKVDYAGNIELHLIDLKEEEQSEWDMYENGVGEEDSEPIEKNLLEAKLTAKKIKELLESDYYVFENNNYRKLTYKDIVILLRKTRDVASIYEEELNKLNIPVYSDTSMEYFESIEIQTIMSLLKIIDNPLQDIPLVSVLRSMIGGFTDNELVEIRLIDKYCNFFEAMKKSKIQVNPDLEYKIEKFISNINKWREEQEYLGLDELIWKIYEETGYYDYVGLMPNGALRQANLKLLFKKAKEYEGASFTGLFNFIKFIDKLTISNNDMGAAKIIGENENVVRIMSIHKSKGLEFPVVFLSNSSKQFNMQDLTDNIILDQDIGLGPKYINYNRQVKYDTLAKEALKIKLKRDNISEEMRILYVALTRAREKLIITGISKDLNKDIQSKKLLLNNENQINSAIVLKYKTYLDWIELVYQKNKDIMKEFVSIYKYKKKDVLQNVEKQEEIDYISELEEKIKSNKNISKELEKQLSWKYEKNELSKIESKMSVSEIKKEKNNQNELVELNNPKFLNEVEDISASRKGTLVHLCMQKLDINKKYDIQVLKELIEELVYKKIILEKEAKSINLNKVLNFTRSKIWKELKNAKKIERERPFYINIPASEIYNNNVKENVLVQGIIDLYYINEFDELILLDYKTDFVENRDETILIDKYKVQLEIYKKALEEALNKKVSKVYIYSTFLDKEIEI